MTILVDLIKQNFFKKAIELINSKKLNINEPDSEGRSPLWWAVQSNNLDLVGLLLSHDANIFTKRKSGETPFTLAVLEYTKSATTLHTEIIRQLLNKWLVDIQRKLLTIDYHDGMDGTLLYWSLFFGAKKNVNWLIQNGANSLIESANGYTALELARESIPQNEFYETTYQQMMQITFPWVFKPNVPLQARVILNGYRWKLPEGQNKLRISYTFNKHQYLPTDLLYRKITHTHKERANGHKLNTAQQKAFLEALKYYSSILDLEFYEAPTPENAQLAIRQARLTNSGKNIGGHTDVKFGTDGYILQACVSLDSEFIKDLV